MSVAMLVRTDRDHDILDALARRSRIMSLAQIAGFWWSGGATPEKHARNRLQELQGAGFLDSEPAISVPIISLPGPVFVWSPGQPDPDAYAVSKALISRWPMVDPVPVLLYFATETTHNQYGGARTPRRPKADHVCHDLHVAELYLKFRRERPEDAKRWIGEDARRKSGRWLKDPDAILDFGSEASPHVVEFGGRYNAKEVAEKHRDCAKRGRSYELW